MSILDVKGRRVREQAFSVAEADFTDRRASVALDIDQLEPGEYILTVEAAGEGHTPSRVLRFAVR